MNAATLSPKQKKTEYSETEAAQELGVTVEQLRLFIRSHIATCDEDLIHIAAASYHASDLLILKLLAGLSHNATAEGSAQ